MTDDEGKTKWSISSYQFKSNQRLAVSDKRIFYSANSAYLPSAQAVGISLRAHMADSEVKDNL